MPNVDRIRIDIYRLAMYLFQESIPVEHTPVEHQWNIYSHTSPDIQPDILHDNNINIGYCITYHYHDTIIIHINNSMYNRKKHHDQDYQDYQDYNGYD